MAKSKSKPKKATKKAATKPELSFIPNEILNKMAKSRPGMPNLIKEYKAAKTEAELKQLGSRIYDSYLQGGQALTPGELRILRKCVGK